MNYGKTLYLKSEILAVISSDFTDRMWQTKSKSRNKSSIFLN